MVLEGLFFFFVSSAFLVVFLRVSSFLSQFSSFSSLFPSYKRRQLYGSSPKHGFHKLILCLF